MGIEAIVVEAVLSLSLLDQLESLDARLKEDLGLDSLSVVELLVLVEEKLNSEIDMGLLMTEQLQTVNDVIGLAQKSFEVQ